jgi:hypothetical protein
MRIAIKEISEMKWILNEEVIGSRMLRNHRVFQEYIQLHSLRYVNSDRGTLIRQRPQKNISSRPFDYTLN